MILEMMLEPMSLEEFCELTELPLNDSMVLVLYDTYKHVYKERKCDEGSVGSNIEVQSG